MNQSVRKNMIFCLLLGLSTFAAFWGVLQNDFINYDDLQYVTANQHVTSGLSKENVVWAFTSGHAANWHPVTWISHMVDVELFGMEPWGHHLLSLLFHITNACLLFLVLNTITGAFWRSALVAGFFALHPLRVESVAWVAERKDVLSTFFGMLTLLAYAGYVRRGGKWRYAVLCGCFALGLMSKPMLVTLPFVLLLLDYWPLRRFIPGESTRQQGLPRNGLPISRLLIEKVPLFALSVASGVVTLYVQAKGDALNSLEVTPLTLRVANALVAYVRYLGKAVCPQDLAVIYPLPRDIPLIQSVGCGMLLMLISFLAFAAAKRRPYLPVGWFWFLGTLVPVIGIVQVGLQSMADRYTYFPVIGLLVAIVWGVSDIATQRAFLRIPLIFAAAGLLVVYSIVTWRYVSCWQNSTTLFHHAIEATTDNYYAHFVYGNALYKDARFSDAIAQYAIASRLNPRFADVFIYMGVIYSKQGNQVEAVDHLNRALALKPASGFAHYNLGVALQAQGRIEEALTHYNEALRLDPDSMELHFNVGVALMDMGKYDEAIDNFSEALRIRPDFEQSRQYLQRCMQLKTSR